MTRIRTDGQPGAFRRSPRHRTAIGLALVLGLGCGAVHAQLEACVAIQDDRQRLACYDAAAHRKYPDSPEAAAPDAGGQLLERPVASAGASELEKRWELRPQLERGTFRLVPYRPIYALVHATNHTHNRPSSPTRPFTAGDVDLNQVESKLQLSFKSKVLENIGGSAADLWLAYTQQSFWQAGNRGASSLFRETNYRPEAILIQPLHMAFGGIRLRYAGLSLTHESNGRGEPLSRSWNRLIGELALESGPWALHVRPWTRIARRAGDRDDNPDIQDYVGRGELVAVYRAAGNIVTLTGRHTLKGGNKSRGGASVEWAFPIKGALNGHVQLSSGYGENLIDYNHRQTTLGFGVSFFD